MPNTRTLDPSTSHQAAASVSNVSATQKAILKLLSIFDMTDQDLIRYYNEQIRMGADARDFPRASESGIRSRRAELVELGLVQDSGQRTTLDSGRKAIVWTVA